MSKKYRKVVWKIAVYTILIIGALLFLFPVLWMLSTALKDPQEVMSMPPVMIPKAWRWSNFVDALNAFPFLRYLANTLFIVVVNSFGALFSASLVGYAFGRLKWPGRDIWFMILIGTMMLPGIVTMIPTFIMFRNLGWINTYLPLLVPTFCGSAFNIFLMRQFFRTIPMDLSESAKIDGCSEIRIFGQIILPLCKPALLTIAINTFMGAWNDYMGPLLYLNDTDKYTITYGLRAFQMQYDTDWNLLMAASLVITLPTLILFFTCQKYFVEGITLTGIKG